MKIKSVIVVGVAAVVGLGVFDAYAWSWKRDKGEGGTNGVGQTGATTEKDAGKPDVAKDAKPADDAAGAKPTEAAAIGKGIWVLQGVLRRERGAKKLIGVEETDDETPEDGEKTAK